MDFKEFVNKLEQDLKDAMADISPGATVDVRSVEKLQDGQSYEVVLAVAVSTAERGLHDMHAVDVSKLRM